MIVIHERLDSQSSAYLLPLNSRIVVGLADNVSPRPRQKDVGPEGLVQVYQTFSKRLVNGLVND